VLKNGVNLSTILPDPDTIAEGWEDALQRYTKVGEDQVQQCFSRYALEYATWKGSLIFTINPQL
jgi:hypothetical protein